MGGQYSVFDSTAQFSSATKVTATAELYDPVTETFTLTGALAAPRFGHTATLLSNGKVLIAGGSTSTANGTTLSIGEELYDPTTGAFQPTGGLRAPRREHTATLLTSGQVLIAGGNNSGGDLTTGELYDPTTGMFSATGSMVSARVGHTATRLLNGKVLLAGGGGFGVPPMFVTAELYDPLTGLFAPTGPMSARRDTHTATLLSDGRVLVVGGRSDGSASQGQGELASAEIYNPDTGAFTLTGSLTTQRFKQTATLLASGKVLIAAGSNQMAGTTILASAELFDPAIGTFSTTGTMVNVRSAHRAVALPGGKILFVGGYEAGNCAEVYDPAVGRFYSRDLARVSHTATALPNGTVLFSAQPDYINVTGPRSAVIFDPSAEVFTATGAQVRSRGGHTATLLRNDKVLMAGSFPWTNTPLLLRADLYDPGTGLFAAPGMTESRSGHTATLLPDGNVLLAGGAPAAYTSAEIYDVANGGFAAATPLLIGRQSHTATMLGNGKVLIVGGRGASTTTGSSALASAELYDPVAKTFTATGALATARYSHTASMLPNGLVLIVGGWTGTVTTGGVYSGKAVANSEVYDPGTGSFSPTGSLGAARYAHAAATLLDGKILIVGGANSPDPSSSKLEPNPLASVELYDPKTGAFTRGPSMTMPRVGPTATVLGGGKVLVVGGNAAGLNGNETLSRAEIYW